MNGWFSRVNPQTGQVASGAGEVFVEGRSLGFGHLFDWFDAQTLLVKGDGDRPTLINIHTGERHELSALPAVHAAAGGGAWMASRDGIIWCSVSRFAERAWIEEHAGSNDDRSLYLDGVPLVQHQPINYCHVDDGHVTWSLFLRGKREVWGSRPGHAPERLDVYAGDSLFCLPVVTPHGAWVVVQSHTALHVAPWGESRGTLIHTGNDNNFHPHAAWTPAGLLVVWNDSRGMQGRQLIDLSRRDDLSLPVPPPPPESPMHLPDDVKATIRAVWPKVAHLHAGSDEDRRTGTRIIIEQIVFSHPGQGYGWKASGPHNPPSKDAMARQVDGKLYYVDLVNGATRELANLDGEMEDITGQHFIDVAGVNHLGTAPVPQPRPTEPIPIITKHRYTRDDDERDECNQPILGGGQCDRPRADPIHQVSTPTDPPDEPIPGDVTLAMLLAEIKRLQNHLGVR